MTDSHSSLVLAAVQMNSHEILDDNLETARDLIIEAAARGADVIGLPENFSLMAETNEQRQDAARRVAEVEAFLSEMAKAQGVVIIGGSTPFPATDGLVTNSCLMFDRAGRRLCRYDKIHLFDVEVSEEEAYRESSYIASGEDLVTTTVEEMMFGLTICYDMRFPELYRALSQRGAEIFSIPSAFTVPTGRAHWHTLLRARAIENLAWVIAPAQVGRHPHGRETYGHSLIVGPWGELIGERSDSPGVVLATINRDAAKQKRARFPSLTHRRL